MSSIIEILNNYSLDLFQGFFCPTGTTIPSPCPCGYYGNSTGVKKSDECTPCPAGQYCAGYGLKEPTGPCDAGFYCSGRACTSVSINKRDLSGCFELRDGRCCEVNVKLL